MIKPKTIAVKARDAVPYRHGIWCTVGGGEPFVNDIVSKKWSDDGTKIVFMLESFNFDFLDPDELIEVVVLKGLHDEYETPSSWMAL